MKILNKAAFTLAEVLITLGIIGMVAQMTIPTLMQSTEKQSNLARLKQFYSTFNQGMQMYMQSQDCSDLACTNIFNGMFQDADYKTNMDKAFSATFKGYIPCADYDCQESVKMLSGDVWTDFFSIDNGYTFKLADGSMVLIEDWDGENCPNWGNPSKITGHCAYIYADVNGNKMPNKMGRDVFVFFLAKSGDMYPYLGSEVTKYMWGDDTSAWKSNDSYCGTAGSPTIPDYAGGWGCAARIVESGWIEEY